MTKPLRIGLFLVAFPQLSETFIVTKVLKLIDNGFDVHIFTLSSRGDWDKFRVLDGRDDVRARVHVVPPLAPLARVLTKGASEVAKTALGAPADFARLALHTWQHHDVAQLSFAKSLYEHVRFVGHQLDILHIEFDYQALGIADLKKYLGCKLLVSARGTFQNSSTYARAPHACEYLFQYVDGYHFISKFLEANMRKLGLPDDVPRWLVEPAIDLSLFVPQPRPARAPGEPLRIVSVGRLAWAKGYEFALDAVARVRDAGIPFKYDIYGAGPYEEALRFAIRELGLRDHVTLVGTRPRDQMPSIYANADLMLHSAIEEGFCNAVIEAQAMELAVVTSDAGGLPENVADRETGFVVPRRNAQALADKVIVLARDEKLRMELGRAGRTRALARFDLERQADLFVKLYRELAALPPRR
jgi:colanic acid/amylovoran biosynthesis glycosyltransferase